MSVIAENPDNGAWHYTKTAVVLHWLLALLIAALLAVGWYMTAFEHEPGVRKYFDLHKSVGLLVLALVALRVIWRAGHRPAELPASLPRWQVIASSIVQWLLYLCMIAMPVVGILGASYSKSGIVFFGWRLPAWHAPNHDLAEQYFSVHGVLAWVLVALIAVHAAAAFKHLLLNRDRVFQRMWF